MSILEDPIKMRRSTRKYNSKDLPDRLLYNILEAARWAPAAGNIQNTRILVIRDPRKKRIIANSCLEQEWISEAPVILIVCSDSGSLLNIYPKKGKFYAIQNTSAAIQNMLLEATSLQVSSCWIGAFSEQELHHELNIPSDIDIFAVITLGFAKEVPLPTNKISPKAMFYFEKWYETKDKGPTQLKEKFKKTLSKFKFNF